jgi:hypothetical protein
MTNTKNQKGEHKRKPAKKNSACAGDATGADLQSPKCLTAQNQRPSLRID